MAEGHRWNGRFQIQIMRSPKVVDGELQWWTYFVRDQWDAGSQVLQCLLRDLCAPQQQQTQAGNNGEKIRNRK
ncbi:hypothetical protein C1H46_024917 [Malus baccata]|uniref:Uncharacterized protein n=1 Tax=Malus baccata TaxID=106549 RepID=A0A540LSY2_MALBA|nr:hypothetical protein C1H46_024917 [Malus baccata]